MYLDIQVITEITLPRSNLDSPPFPQAPLWITFLPFISQKILFNIKEVEFDCRMGYIRVLFLFLWIITVQFTNFGFLNFEFFLFLNTAILACFYPKLPFLSLKLLLNYFYKQNMYEIALTEAGWAWKVQNFPFLPSLAAQNSSHTQTFKYMSQAQFSS